MWQTINTAQNASWQFVNNAQQILLITNAGGFSAGAFCSGPFSALGGSSQVVSSSWNTIVTG